MAGHETEALTALREALGARPAPRVVTQKAFDFNTDHLHRLARLAPGDQPQPADLWEYMQDLRYTEIQRELLIYLLPFCLQAWQDNLCGGRDHLSFVEHLYPVLADCHVFDIHLTPEQTAAVSAFMRQAILAEIDDQRGLSYRGMNARPHRWITAMTTYGVLLPDIEQLWTPWWALGTTGRATASVQFVSILMYPDDANPVFAPWTPDQGGGAPCFWEFGGHLYSHRWLDANVDFLRATLNVAAVTDLITRAVATLTSEPEHTIAAQVADDIPMRLEMLTARCAELPSLLATTQDAGTLLEWSS